MINPASHYCACYCKDTHFEAIHNKTPLLSFVNVDCACYCKDTHFEAIHNGFDNVDKSNRIVLATAKIHILKQFTTLTVDLSASNLLCLLLQRYTFWSNSQHRNQTNVSRMDCACYCKDTHFEAIHNTKGVDREQQRIVLATAKIHILKQFTTINVSKDWSRELCLLLQRYTFWSNSQHRHSLEELKAIVLATAKIHILKQFTTVHDRCTYSLALCLLLQRYTFWSNSQLN